MNHTTLNGAWEMRVAGEAKWEKATVPGSVYNDLIEVGRLPDPYWRDNEMLFLKLMDNDFEYRRHFEVSKELLACDAVLLRCEGLDTLADVSINGKLAGSADNMHRVWEFDAAELLHEGENEITVKFSSPTKYIKEAYAECAVDGSSDAMVGFPHLRKAHCMFGWDWGPRLPDAGIWKDITLVGVQQARIDSVYVTQEHTNGQVVLSFETGIDLYDDDPEALSCVVTVTSKDGREYTQNEDGDILIEDARLWWPNGYGSQPLYTVKARLLRGDTERDKWEKRIGLRTMTVSRDRDEWGEGFAFTVNGVKIFAMGADYIPEDNIFPRMSEERTRKLLSDCVSANMNAVRVWGGGFYPHDYFYDLCDELGLVVWQDMMFACAVYELTPEFKENIRRELIDNVKRLRHHPSLGLWCGNNEMEWQIHDDRWILTPKQYGDYIRMYEYLFPEVLEEYDPNTFYWPASPSSGGGFDEPNDFNRGDVHYWEVWHGNKPFSDYRNYFFRFASEFGFQSFPDGKTVQSYTLPGDRNIFSFVMEKHQRNGSANGKIMNYMAQTFRYPADFDTLVYASQLLQAEAIRYGVEHWRRNRGRCMGAIYWQLNDCWPVASWASIDYFGRWKALHYYAKRFFAPVLLSCSEEGVITQRPNVNAENYEQIEKSARLCVSNETRSAFQGEVRWALRDTSSKVLKDGSVAVSVPALSSVWLDKMDFADAPLYGSYLSFELIADGKAVSSGTAIFCPPKHFAFVNPELSYTVSGDELVIRSKAYARGVQIESADGDALFSDNYFDMGAGEKRVKILSGSPKSVKLSSVYNIGR